MCLLYIGTVTQAICVPACTFVVSVCVQGLSEANELSADSPSRAVCVACLHRNALRASVSLTHCDYDSVHEKQSFLQNVNTKAKCDISSQDCLVTTFPR